MLREILFQHFNCENNFQHPLDGWRSFFKVMITSVLEACDNYFYRVFAIYSLLSICICVFNYYYYYNIYYLISEPRKI